MVYFYIFTDIKYKDMSELTKEPTKEQVEQMLKHRADLEEFYAEQIPFLESQAKYEKLLTDIDVAKMTRFEILMARTRLMQKPEDDQDTPESQNKEG